MTLTNVTNAQTVTVTLYGVSNGTGTSDVGVPMSLLVGDSNANRVVNSGDVAADAEVAPEKRLARFELSLRCEYRWRREQRRHNHHSVALGRLPAMTSAQLFFGEMRPGINAGPLRG